MYTIFFINTKKKKDVTDEHKSCENSSITSCNLYERSSSVCKQEKKKALTFLMDKFIIHCYAENVHR